MPGGKQILSFVCILIVLFLTVDSAYAHIPCLCNNPQDQCTCFIQLGDKGPAVKEIVKILIEKGYLKNIAKKSVFTPEVKQAVIQFQSDNQLVCTGWMDDETLDALLFDVLPDSSDKYTEESWGSIYFVPTDGGIRYHSDPTCCDMHNPRMISGVNARCLGIKHCGLESCRRSIPLTYKSLGLEPRRLPDSYYIQEENKELQESNLTRGMIDPEDYESKYIGNKKTHVFHQGSCASVKSMKEGNKVEFLTREEAVAEGYTPCSRCNP